MAVSFFMPFKSTDGRAVVQNRYSRAGAFAVKLLQGTAGAGQHFGAAAGASFFLFAGETPAFCLFGI